MSVTTNTRRVDLTGTGTSFWSVSFPITLTTQPIVYDINTGVSPATAALLTKDVDYSVSLLTPADLPSSFTITLIPGSYPTGLVANHKLVVYRDVQPIQDRVFLMGEAFPESAVELALDLVVMAAQDARGMAERSIRAPQSDDAFVPPLQLPGKATRASKYLIFDSTGGVTVASPPAGTTTVSSFGATLITAADAAAALAALGLSIPNGILAGTRASRPAAGAGNTGYWHLATDTGQLSRSNGTTWFEANIGIFDQSTLPAPAIADRVVLDRQNRALYLDSGSALNLVRSLPPNHLSGIVMVRASTTTVQFAKISAAPSVLARDAGDTGNMALSASMTKVLQVGSDWSAGNNGNGRPNTVALSANTWYGCFLIAKPDGTTDAGFDTSLTATNLLARATAVSGATWNRYRRVGWIRTDGSSNILNFLNDGDFFWWETSQASGSLLAQNISGGTDFALTHVPPSVLAQVIALLRDGTIFEPFAFGVAGTTMAAPASPATGVAMASPGAAFIATNAFISGINAFAGPMLVRTDASRQIKIRTAADTSVDISFVAHWWIDDRRAF